VNTHLPDFAASTAGFTGAFATAALLTVLLADLLIGLGAGLAALFLSGLRAEAAGAGFARTGVDDFDFRCDFLRLGDGFGHDLQTSARGEEVRALHHFGRLRARREASPKDLQGYRCGTSEQAQARHTDENQIDRDHQIGETAAMIRMRTPAIKATMG